MSENQLFNLEKIKEFTLPIEELQVKVNQLREHFSINKKNMLFSEKYFFDENFMSQFEDIKRLLEKLNKKLLVVSNNNINKFLDFKDRLIKKYKDKFKANLKKLYLDKILPKKIGLFLIENKKISKIIDHVSFIPSIEIHQWLQLLESLKYNTLFSKSVENLKIFYKDLLHEKLERELSKIPKNTNPTLIKEYKKNFQDDPSLTFNNFFLDIESKLTQKELKAKKDIIEKTREKEEFEKLKKKQEEHKETYEDYLKLSNREFERRRRKKKRQKLPDISLEPKEEKQIEISDEISEKIQKFKSQFEKRFEETYLIHRNDDEDPLDLVRERIKRKKKEYKKFKDHFENV